MMVGIWDLMILKTAFQSVSSFSERQEYRKRKDRRDPNNPVPHLLQAQPALTVLLPKSPACPGTESYSTIAQSDYPKWMGKTRLYMWTSNAIFNNGDMRRDSVIPDSSPIQQLRFYAKWMLTENSTQILSSIVSADKTIATHFCISENLLVGRQQR